ncbi:MAG TPA: GNAT family N-acetyltransferase [Arachnia sp.]|nr:GNAT family N-acetyltransferase [Arachnia sp.]HMT86688.1 GNAT family N-acetyltransferase [Arachnia sp.]
MSASNTVRLAMPAEAVDIARIQRRAWGEHPLLAEGAASVRSDEAVQSWHEAIVKPPLAHCRVLVALAEDNLVAGFAVTGPCGDPDAEPTDAEIVEFVVDAAQRGNGHGSRLITAAVDTLRADGFEVAHIWVPAANDALRAFLTGCGFAADGAHQEIAMAEGAPSLKLVRLHAAISG